MCSSGDTEDRIDGMHFPEFVVGFIAVTLGAMAGTPARFFVSGRRGAAVSAKPSLGHADRQCQRLPDHGRGGGLRQGARLVVGVGGLVAGRHGLSRQLYDGLVLALQTRALVREGERRSAVGYIVLVPCALPGGRRHRSRRRPSSPSPEAAGEHRRSRRFAGGRRWATAPPRGFGRSRRDVRYRHGGGVIGSLLRWAWCWSCRSPTVDCPGRRSSPTRQDASRSASMRPSPAPTDGCFRGTAHAPVRHDRNLRRLHYLFGLQPRDSPLRSIGGRPLGRALCCDLGRELARCGLAGRCGGAATQHMEGI